ncbi:MAG: 30S ribosomal protein S5, partial [Bacteroidota bacterium]
MSEEKKQEATTDTAVKDTAVADTAAATAATDAPAAQTDETQKDGAKPTDGNRERGRGGRGERRNPRRPRRNNRRDERARPEYDQKIIGIRRVTRVMAGGRRFSFSVSMVIGDKKGKVGVGIGKAADTQLAIEKAARNAKKNLMIVPMNKEQQIAHDVHTMYASSEVMI